MAVYSWFTHSKLWFPIALWDSLPEGNFNHRIGWWENFNRKPLYLMVKTMVSRFSLKPIHWFNAEESRALLDLRFRQWNRKSSRWSPHDHLHGGSRCLSLWSFSLIKFSTFREFSKIILSWDYNTYICIYIYMYIYIYVCVCVSCICVCI